MKVLKFGGSSVGSPEVILAVKKIVEQQEIGTIVVVSAFKGVTDQLIKMANLAKARDKKYSDELVEMRQRHIDTVLKVIDSKINQDRTVARVTEILKELEDVMNGVYFLRDLTDKTMDYILSFGERLSSFVISEVIDNAYLSDARNFIRTDDQFGNAQVDFEVSNKTIQKHFEVRNHYFVVPGFIASNASGDITTLGRGGSDYSAAIIAGAINATVLEIWTDVDGFMTADPRLVSKAYPIDTMTYAEAMELSHFGAKVIYTPTIRPVYLRNIPVLIKNTFNPSAKGTIINRRDAAKKESSQIKGISSIDTISLLSIQGVGLVGAKGSSKRLFSALAKYNVNVILITQASSEFSITFAVTPADAERAVQGINEEFKKEMEQELIRLLVEKDMSIIAIVGEGMKNTPGISSNLFKSLAINGVNVVATAQGSSELNISVVVKKESLKKAMNAIHEGFFLSGFKELNLFMVGRGNVGGSLLGQLKKQNDYLKEKYKLKINLVGITDDQKMLFNQDGLDFLIFEQELDRSSLACNLDEFVKQIAVFNLRNSVFIDCTASAAVAAQYKKVLESYASVVTANKIACSSEYRHYEELIRIARDRGLRFMYETNVGAGLPIIKTIDDLVHSGDKILKIEAVLSGTLNYIFNVIAEDIPMSKAIKMAQEKGYSEPDPRIDLSGTDVVRKILILARQSGYPIEMEQVKVNTFLPAECFAGSIEDFWTNVKKQDAEFEAKRKELAKENKKWRFVASLDNGITSVQLMIIDSSHPAYHLEGSNNIVLITTERYKELPMVIKGYGAGAEVTAAGVFADIMRIANI